MVIFGSARGHENKVTIFSRWWATLISVLAVFGYSLMVGATASVVRAAIMGRLARSPLQKLSSPSGCLNALFPVLYPQSSPTLPGWITACQWFSSTDH
jgi:predicted membrane metal-binding protein